MEQKIIQIFKKVVAKIYTFLVTKTVFTTISASLIHHNYFFFMRNAKETAKIKLSSEHVFFRALMK